MVLELSRDTVYMPGNPDFYLEITDESVVIDWITLSLSFRGGVRKEHSPSFWGFGEAYIYPVGYPPVCKADHSIFVNSTAGVDNCCRAMGWQGLDLETGKCVRHIGVNIVNPRLLVKGQEVWRYEGDATGKTFNINIDPETINLMADYGCNSDGVKLPLKIVADAIGEASIELSHGFHIEKGKAKIVALAYPDRVMAGDIVDIIGQVTNTCPVGGADITLDMIDIATGDIVVTRGFSLDESQIGDFNMRIIMPERDIGLRIEARHKMDVIDDARSFSIAFMLPPPPPPEEPELPPEEPVPPPLPPPPEEPVPPPPEEPPEEPPPEEVKLWPIAVGGALAGIGLVYLLWREYGRGS